MSTDTVTLFLGLLTWVAMVIVAGTVIMVVAARFSPAAAESRESIRSGLGPNALLIAWIVALIATVGSLYFSEVADFIPCKLCWYQRIAMYPLVVILGVGLFRKDAAVRWYAAPLAAIGGLISLYHYGVQRLPALDSGACSVDAPCTFIWVDEFGFMSIPFMALLAFCLILVLLLAWISTTSEVSA